MSGKGYQTLLECRRRGFLLRGRGFTIDQIAVVLSLDHDATPLRLYRYAAGLTAAQVVAEFNAREPSGTAPLRESRLYDYETWPDAGRRPPAWALWLLGQIYGTRPSQLLTPAAYATYSRHDQDILRDCLVEKVPAEGTQRKSDFRASFTGKLPTSTRMHERSPERASEVL